MVPKIVEQCAQFVPAIAYDDLVGYSKLMSNAQVWIGVLGCLGWFGGQWALVSTVFGFVALISFDVKSVGLMKYCAMSILPLIVLDIVWMATYAKEADTVRTKWVLACVLFLFFMRVPQFFVYSKMWVTDFGENEREQQGNVGGTTTTLRDQYSSPGVGVRLDDVETTPNGTGSPPPYQPPSEFA